MLSMVHQKKKKKKVCVGGDSSWSARFFLSTPLHHQEARPTGAGTLSNVFTAESAAPENGRHVKIYAE